jgi:hypothetical protein
MTSVTDALSGVGNLAFDTAPLIYFVNAHPSYVALMRDIIQRVDSGQIAGVSLAITPVEVLTRPKQTGRTDIEDDPLSSRIWVNKKVA